jgi:4-diphosphocytidyl-2-C-methyl-D-erythritol kinase
MPIFTAKAKLNLFLNVLSRDPDGFHQIETLFCRIQLADEIEIEKEGNGIHLHVKGAALGEPESNLMFRAAKAFERYSGRQVHARMLLRKHIPAGSGLGGGSSDAAVTLRALNELNGHPLAASDLHRAACSLGSDVPFFLYDASLALATGRGERLLLLPPVARACIVLVIPDIGISTADAYRELASRRERERATPRTPSVSPEMIHDWNSIQQLAGNDFEPIAFEWIPELRRVRDALRHAGAHIAMLTGSGSALFGAFMEHATCEHAAHSLQQQFPGYNVIVTETS